MRVTRIAALIAAFRCFQPAVFLRRFFSRHMLRQRHLCDVSVVTYERDTLAAYMPLICCYAMAVMALRCRRHADD